MNDQTRAGLKETILTLLYSHLCEQQLNVEAGQIRIADHDIDAIYLGLFPINQTTGDLEHHPTTVITIEVSMQEGGKS